MKKASSILLKVGAILAFVAAGCLFIAAMVYLTMTILLSAGLLNEAIKNGSIKVDNASSIDAAVIVLTATFITMTIVFLVIAAFSLVSGILSLKARKSGTRKAHIVSIVFAVLSENYVSLAGSILGIIVNKKEENSAKKAEKEVVEEVEVKDVEAK